MEFITERLKHTVSFSHDDGKMNCEDEKFKLSFAFQDLSEMDPKILPERTDSIRILDLTENNFTGASNNLRFLYDFPNLKTLILDKNQIQSNFILPPMNNLTTLWVNHNQIENLAIFIENVAKTCPNLTYLSMINNKASPSYFNQGTLTEYNDYRYYVISKLTNLSMLDDKVISPEERSQARTIYGYGRVVRRSSESASKKNRKSLGKSGRSDSLRSSEPTGAERKSLTRTSSQNSASESVQTKPPNEDHSESKEAKKRSSVKKEKRTSKAPASEENRASTATTASVEEANGIDELPDLVVDNPNETVTASEPPVNSDPALQDLPDLQNLPDPAVPALIAETEEEKNLDILPDIIEDAGAASDDDTEDAESLEEENLNYLPTIYESNDVLPDVIQDEPAAPLAPTELESLPDLSENQDASESLIRPSLLLLKKANKSNQPPLPPPTA